MVKNPSPFIRPIHPKAKIRADAASIRRVLDAGWWGQPKIHGHRAQIHIPPDPDGEIIVYNRHGQRHRKALPSKLASELRRLVGPKHDWNVLDGEWLKSEDKIYLFDWLKREGEVLHKLTYAERYELLPRVYASDCIETLPVFKNVESCLKELENPDPRREGLVFRSPDTRGFSDTSIVRCRK